MPFSKDLTPSAPDMNTLSAKNTKSGDNPQARLKEVSLSDALKALDARDSDNPLEDFFNAGLQDEKGTSAGNEDCEEAARATAIRKANGARESYFNNFNELYPVMKQRQQALQHYADEAHDDPLARKYAYQIQKSMDLNQESDNFLQAVMEAVEEIQNPEEHPSPTPDNPTPDKMDKKSPGYPV